MKKRTADQMSTQQRKEASKKGKRVKLQSGGDKSILDIQFQKFRAKQEANPETADEHPPQLSVAELRSRLQGELAELSSARKAKMVHLQQRRAEARERRKEEPREDHRVKRKDTKAMREEAKEEEEMQAAGGSANNSDDDGGSYSEREEEQEHTHLLSNAKLSEKRDTRPAKGVSKYKLLRDAQAAEAELNAIEDPEARKLAMEDKSWDEALLKAQGAKLGNNVKLLKKTIKREQKKKKKSAQKWADRVRTVDEMKAERQEKRKFNIAAHQKKKKDWKAGLKVSKKPGFEGKYTNLPKKGVKQKQKKDVSQKSKYKKVKV